MSNDEKKVNPLLDQDDQSENTPTNEGQGQDNSENENDQKPETEPSNDGDQGTQNDPKDQSEPEAKVEVKTETSAPEPTNEGDGSDENATENKPQSEQRLPQSASQQDIGIEYSKMSEKMKKHLSSQPKVNFLIPLIEGEKDGAYETVQINGYRMVIKKGVMVTIPQQVAEILADHYRVSAEAGNAFKIDRAGDIEKALS